MTSITQDGAVEFRFYRPAASSVAIVGEFNQWHQDDLAMEPTGDGWWTAIVDLKPGEYYHYQVVGFEVFSTAGERIGVISSVLSTAGGELYVIQGREREHLIPAVKEFIDKVDFDAGKMIIDPPPGLLDL